MASTGVTSTEENEAVLTSSQQQQQRRRRRQRVTTPPPPGAEQEASASGSACNHPTNRATVSYCQNGVQVINEQNPHWGRTAKIRDVSTGPLARPFALSLVRLLVCLHCTERFAHALCCAHLFARSLTRSPPCSWESGFLVVPK